jgi:hypothetical protein
MINDLWITISSLSMTRLDPNLPMNADLLYNPRAVGSEPQPDVQKWTVLKSKQHKPYEHFRSRL